MSRRVRDGARRKAESVEIDFETVSVERRGVEISLFSFLSFLFAKSVFLLCFFFFYIEALLFFFSNSCVLELYCLLARGTKGGDEGVVILEGEGGGTAKIGKREQVEVEASSSGRAGRAVGRSSPPTPL